MANENPTLAPVGETVNAHFGEVVAAVTKLAEAVFVGFAELKVLLGQGSFLNFNALAAKLEALQSTCDQILAQFGEVPAPSTDETLPVPPQPN